MFRRTTFVLPWTSDCVPKDINRRGFHRLLESRPFSPSTPGVHQPEGCLSPMLHLWLVYHPLWCIHPPKFSPRLQPASGHCSVRKLCDHPATVPSRRSVQAFPPLLALFPKILRQQRASFLNSRPQGLDPESNPLHQLLVAQQSMPVTPLGFCSSVRRHARDFCAITRVMVPKFPPSLSFPSCGFTSRLERGEPLPQSCGVTFTEAKAQASLRLSRPRGLPFQPLTSFQANLI